MRSSASSRDRNGGNTRSSAGSERRCCLAPRPSGPSTRTIRSSITKSPRRAGMISVVTVAEPRAGNVTRARLTPARSDGANSSPNATVRRTDPGLRRFHVTSPRTFRAIARGISRSISMLPALPASSPSIAARPSNTTLARQPDLANPTDPPPACLRHPAMSRGRTTSRPQQARRGSRGDG